MKFKRMLPITALLLCAVMLMGLLCACEPTDPVISETTATPDDTDVPDANGIDDPSSVSDDGISPVEGIENAMIDSGAGNSYAYISPDGVLYTWGCNDGAGLGTGSVYDEYAPVEVARDVRWADFAVYGNDVGRKYTMLLYITDDGQLCASGCLPVDLFKEDPNLLGSCYSLFLGDEAVELVSIGEDSALFVYTDAGNILYYDHLYNNYMFHIPEATEGNPYPSTRQYLNDTRLNGKVREISAGSFITAFVTTDDELYLFDMNSQELMYVCDGVASAHVCGTIPNVVVLKQDGSLYIQRCYDPAAGAFADDFNLDTAAPVLENVTALDFDLNSIAALNADGSAALFVGAVSDTPDVNGHYCDFMAAHLPTVNDAAMVFADAGGGAGVIYINHDGDAYYLPVDGEAEFITSDAAYAHFINGGVGAFVIRLDGSVVTHTRTGCEHRFLGLGYGVYTAPECTQLVFE